MQKAVILRATATGFQAHQLVANDQVSVPMVVWTAVPGRADAWDHTKSVIIPNESIVIEQMEAWASQYYWKQGRMRYLTTSN